MMAKLLLTFEVKVIFIFLEILLFFRNSKNFIKFYLINNFSKLK